MIVSRLCTRRTWLSERPWIARLHGWLLDSLIQIAPNAADRRCSVLIERLAGQERGFSRALVLGDALTLNNNVFGSEPRLHQRIG